MAHLYFKAKEGFARQAPKEVRILKHLLTVEGERERAQALEQAFEQGATRRAPSHALLLLARAWHLLVQNVSMHPTWLPCAFSTHPACCPTLCCFLAAPGPELEAGDVDYLCTKPADLLNTIENVLTVYDTSRRKVTMAGEASALMNPQASMMQA